MTPSEGIVDRLMRGSVERALKMQPRRTTTIRDELLYAAPQTRDLVASISAAGRRLVDGGLAPRTAGAIAVRRSPTSATRTRPGADLGALDNRMLESVDIDDDPVLAALRHDGAAIRCWPPALVAAGGLADVVPSLAERLPVVSGVPGPHRLVADPDGSWIAIAPDVGTAIEWIEIAEHAARIEARRKA